MPFYFTFVFAYSIILSFPMMFLQSQQTQSSWQILLLAKHSQYIFRQNVFLQVHPMRFFFPEQVVGSAISNLNAKESS